MLWHNRTITLHCHFLQLGYIEFHFISHDVVITYCNRR